MASPFPFTAGQVLTAAQLNGIGEYSDYTPTFSNISFSSYTARYAIVNKMLHIWFSGALDSTVTGNIGISAPVAYAPADSKNLMSGLVFARDDNANVGYWGVVRARTSPTFQFISTTNGNTLVANTWDANAPFTWASGDILSFSIVLEAS